MSKTSGFKVAVLAASIALAMGSTAVMAATAPAATQLPGQGVVAGGTTGNSVTAGTVTSGAQTITINNSSSVATTSVVINWGVTSGATLNTGATAQPGGFNVGSGATLTFSTGANITGSAAVLNVDKSGNPSQIFGALNDAASPKPVSIFVANANGIIVGPTATIASQANIGLVGNTLGATSGFDGTNTNTIYGGTGGDVTVAKPTTGGGINAAGTVLISGGGTVNVDLGAIAGGALTLSAGIKTDPSSLVTNNSSAALNVTGTQAGGTLSSFGSGGNASSSGTLALGAGTTTVGGTLTNNGTLALTTGFVTTGGLVNNKTVTAGAATFGSAQNNGTYTGSGLLTTTKGDLTNSGTLSATGLAVAGNLTNNGTATLTAGVTVAGGNLVNNGGITGVGTAAVTNGNITNNGKLTGFGTVSTATDGTAKTAVDYSITNAGTISNGAAALTIDANSGNVGATADKSTGSFTNTGTLDLTTDLTAGALNDLTLGGSVTKGGKALSAKNALNAVTLAAGGVLTDSAALFFNSAGGSHVASFTGDQVKLMANVADASADGSGFVSVVAGAAPTDDYAVRVASGVTISADVISVDGDSASDAPNVILQGTLSGNSIWFGGTNAVGDVFSGPAGSLDMADGTVATPFLFINSTGRVKTAPYLNDANNFRFNYLPVTISSTAGAVDLQIEQDNAQGTPLSAVNLLVNGDVNLMSTGLVNPVGANGTAVTGVTNTPNTHLVLQASGNIATSGAFYWPGYVYLGNVSADANGNALAGTLGFGTIALGGEFSNVLPGDTAGASGIHFITQFPLNLGGNNVLTNANAWVNFGTDLLTQKYAGEQSSTSGPFFGGTQGSGKVVNYNALDPSNFVTQAPSANR